MIPLSRPSLRGLALGALLAALPAHAAHLSGTLTFSARMDGMQEVPPVSTAAGGTAALILNESMDTLCVRLAVDGLSGPVTGLHLHAGAAGANGPVLVGFTGAVDGNFLETTVTGADLDDALLRALLAGTTYLNVHTDANPDGEIRGQVRLETDANYSAALDGTNEVPPVTGPALGRVNATVSLDGRDVRVFAVAHALSGPITGAHLHEAAAGSNGPVVLDFTGAVSGNVIDGTFPLTADLRDALAAGMLYLNVHTAANPNGEIRGQLMATPNLAFDALMDGGQEVPAVTTGAMGAAWFRLGTGMDSLWFDLVATGLSGPITGLHLHAGEAGANGDVVVDLTPMVNGNRAMGLVTGAGLDAALVTAMLRGGIYLNLHTDANPAGEIRGQVYRLAREGYSARIEGAQEVPAVATGAMGAALVTMDRDQEDLHVMIVASGLSGPLMGAHFHEGAAGMNGPVFYDLTPWFSGSQAYGYWTADDADPFEPADALRFREGMAYLNLHTAANPDGEIRGQVERGPACAAPLGTAVVSPEADAAWVAWPNPASGSAFVRVPPSAEGGRATLIDRTGRIRLGADLGAPGSVQRLDLGGLPAGLYLLRLTDARGLPAGTRRLAVR